VSRAQKLVLLGQFTGNNHQTTPQRNTYTPKGAWNPGYGRHPIDILPAQAGSKGPNQVWGYPKPAPATNASAMELVLSSVLMQRYYVAPDQTVNEKNMAPVPANSAVTAARAEAVHPQPWPSA
jgi:hypothetical protein